MTFLSRRKRPTTPRACPARPARKIISAALVWLASLSAAHAQYILPPSGNSTPITPKFVPANSAPVAPAVAPPVIPPPSLPVAPVLNPPAPVGAAPVQATVEPPIERAAPAALTQLQPLQPRTPSVVGEGTEIYLRTDPPGPQRLFQRDSEPTMFKRIAHNMMGQQSGTRAIFPEEPVISTETYKPRVLRPNLIEVEPSYLVHGRLYFEQPNFERAGYDLGVLTPGINLAVFSYDLLLLPYHACSNLRMCYEASAGNSLKCLPGDPSPFLWPCERFSVTGLVGQSGAVVGGIFLFP